MLTLIGLKAGRNVLVDGSLRDAKWYIQYVQNLTNEFTELNIGIINVTSSLETLLHRAQTRAELTGRHVPTEIIRETFEQVPRSVTDLTPYADAIITFENDIKSNILRCDEHSCLLEPICHNITYPKVDESKSEIKLKITSLKRRVKTPTSIKKNSRSTDQSNDNIWWREEFRELFEINCLIPDFSPSRKSESTINSGRTTCSIRSSTSTHD